MQTKEYYSPGKLMISGEYAVLDAATAFALPCKKGQHLKVTYDQQSEHAKLEWKAFDEKGLIWFEAVYSLPYLIIETTSNSDIAIQLTRFLLNAKSLQTNFLTEALNIQVETRLEFGLDEGLGSSSTLCNNISSWAGVNPYELHFASFKGSGFDIAVAQEAKPLLYTMHGTSPLVETSHWDIPFKDKLFFVHLNKKQNSRDAIAAYRHHSKPSLIAQISRISRLLSVNRDYFEFCLLIELAENEMSQVLKRETIKQSLFPDFHGSIKSLGAWGGDYILATGNDVMAYFQSKGYPRIIPYQAMILS